MFLPIYLFWNYLSPFPWWLGPVLQIIGIFLLWTTRLTDRMYPKWGNRYYLFCSLARPFGILLLAWAWLEIFSVQPDFPLRKSLRDASELFIAIFYLGLLLFALTDRFLLRFILPFLIFCFLGTAVILNPMLPGISGLLLSLAFAGWSIISLGLRRSFLYARIDDPLIVNGPYQYFRHPQLLSAILVNLSGIWVFAWGYNDARFVAFQLLNSLVLIIGLYLITRSEDWDLEKRIGEAYRNYKKQIPGFWSFRKRPGVLKWRNAVGICFLSCLSTCIIISISEVGANGNPSRILLVRNIYAGSGRASWHVQGSLESLARSLEAEEGKFPAELEISDQIKYSLTNRILFNGPVTIFYCGKKYILTRAPLGKPNPRRRLQAIKPVEELPFELECNEQKVELAGAYNFDDDDFLSVILVIRNGETVETIIAGDDSEDQYAPEIVSRLKSRLKSPAR